MVGFREGQQICSISLLKWLIRFFSFLVYEGHCPSHIVVMDRGLFWRLEVLDPATGELYTPPQLEAGLEEIRKLSAAQSAGVPIGALTCLERTEWYRVSFLIFKEIANMENRSVSSKLGKVVFADKGP